MKYNVFGAAGTANITAATAGLISINCPASTSTPCSKVYEWSVGPGANSADNTYAVRFKRNTTAGTYSAVTPSPLDKKASASLTVAGVAQTAAGGTDVELGRWGFHMRGGYRWVSIPGGEYALSPVFSNGLFLEYIFAQGTDVMEPTLFFDE
jgi:hypothetical protein